MPKVATVATPSLEYDAMAEKWEIIRDLNGGTKRMREKGEKYLPKEPNEEQTAYDNRLNRSFLHDGYKSGVRRMVARPFSKSIKIQGELPEQIAGLEEDVDGTGRSLTQLGKEFFTWAIHGGMSHVLVDMDAPDIGDDNGGGGRVPTQADSNAMRVNLIHVRPIDLIAATPGRGGLPSMVRIRETTVEPDGMFGQRTVERIRVIWGREVSPIAGTGAWQTYRAEVYSSERDIDEYTEVATDSTGALAKWEPEQEEPQPYGWPGDGVPLVTTYTNRVADLISEPAMEELAWLNIMHWQSQSDQRNILRFLRLGVLLFTGVSDEIAKRWRMGPINFLFHPDLEADVKTANFQEGPANVGRQDLIDIEERMEAMALLPMVTKSGDVTATAAAIDTAQMQSDIQSWIRDLEHALRRCMEYACTWRGIELPEDVGVDVYSDFPLPFKADKDIDKLILLRNARQIRPVTFFEETRRRQFWAENFDIDAEVAYAEEQDTLNLPPANEDDFGEEAEDDDAGEQQPAGEDAA